jgi:hypothetical protein
VSVTRTNRAVWDANGMVTTAPVPVPVAMGELHVVPLSDVVTEYARGKSVAVVVVSRRSSVKVRWTAMSTWNHWFAAWFEVVVHRVVALPSMAFPGLAPVEALAVQPDRDNAVRAAVRCSIFAPSAAVDPDAGSGRDAWRHPSLSSAAVRSVIAATIRLLFPVTILSGLRALSFGTSDRLRDFEQVSKLADHSVSENQLLGHRPRRATKGRARRRLTQGGAARSLRC